MNQAEHLKYLRQQSETWFKQSASDNLYVYGTIVEVNGTTVKLRRAGESFEDKSYYETLGPWTPLLGQRVFCGRIDGSGNLVVLGPINYLLPEVTVVEGETPLGLKFDAGEFVFKWSGSEWVVASASFFPEGSDDFTQNKIRFRDEFAIAPQVFLQIVHGAYDQILDGGGVYFSYVYTEVGGILIDGFLPKLVTTYDQPSVNEEIHVLWLAAGLGV